MPPEILGPLGLLVGAVTAVTILWREHLKADADDRRQRDEAADLLRQSLANNAAAIAAWDRRTAAEAARQRRTDPK